MNTTTLKMSTGLSLAQKRIAVAVFHATAAASRREFIYQRLKTTGHEVFAVNRIWRTSAATVVLI
jgi:hypothetical protein